MEHEISLELNYVCRNSEPDNEFTLFAKILGETEDKVTIQRYMRWGKLDCGVATLSRKDFELFYEKR